MCFDPVKVKRYITRVQKAYKNKDEKQFDLYIALLAKELNNVSLKGIDMDALVHSFM
jgi:hypothetical protein